VLATVGGVEIRPLERRDAEPTRDIYNDAVNAGIANLDHFPRTAEEHLAWVDGHFGSHPAIVAVDEDGTVLGFAAVSPYQERTGYTTTVEDSIYVHANHHGRGVGRALLEHLCRLAGDMGFHTVIARVTAGNDGSIALHEACGFERIGIEREVGRKRGRWFDVIVLQRML